MSYDTGNKNDLADRVGESATTVLTALEREWREMCGNQLRPTHAGLNPARMEKSLSYAFVLKRSGAGKAHLRVAGQKMHDFFGEALAGREFTDLFDDAAKETAAELMETAFTLPSIVSFSIIAKRSFGRRPVRAQVLLLPMRDPLGNISRLLGAVVTDGTACPHPLRFEIDHTQPIRCDTQSGAFPDRRTGPRSWSKKNGRAKLRLVVDNTV